MNEIQKPLWHEMPVSAVIEKWATDPENGLDAAEAKRRYELYGSNTITQKSSKPVWLVFLLQFHQPLIYILLIAGVITAVLGELVDSSVIFGVVLMNAVIGFWQEVKALRAIQALSQSVPNEATVIRGGQKMRILASNLTLGDIVLLQSGDKVPADLRLIQVRELQIAESALTGESLPVQKSVEQLPADTVLAERHNMAYSSTLVTYGTGKGLVVAIGDSTEIGRINDMIATADLLETPLTRQIARFSLWVLYVIMALSVITFIVGVLRGESVLDMFLAAVALAVGAIPEGLPAAMTIILSIGVSVMARRHAIVRKLPAVETLGSTTVICSDKTGTLTQNQMTVQRIWAAGQSYTVSGNGYEPKGEFSGGEKDNVALRECLTAGLLCNDSRMIFSDGQWKVEGDPTEGALIVSAQKAGLAPKLPRLDTIPFESEHQYMATLHQGEPHNIIYVKGSVEKVLARCSHQMMADGSLEELDTSAAYQWADAVAASGLRILALASKVSPLSRISHSDVESGLVLLGLQAMIDPPREEVIAAVAECKQAGIQVKMITGDHQKTALAIAQTIGIISSPDAPSLGGKAIAALSDEELAQTAPHVNVFARVAPQDKLRLVKALQSKGHTVAMTGDGVNDAPSLRQANIGIAMGITGTDVAKETADMVLTDDNFASIAAAVEEGRGVYDNLVKFIVWTLPTNFGEGLVILVAVLLGLPLPILPVQILWINMTTAVLLGLMLSFEPKEPGIMLRQPRKSGEAVLTPLLIFRIVVVGTLLCLGCFVLYEFALSEGKTQAAARTVAANVFVMGELFYLFNCRSLRLSSFKIGFFTNPILLLSSVLMLGLQIMYTYAPFMNLAFHTEPIAVMDWGYIVLVSTLIYILVEIEKKLIFKLHGDMQKSK